MAKCLRNSDCKSGFCNNGWCKIPSIGEPCKTGTCIGNYTCDRYTERCTLFPQSEPHPEICYTYKQCPPNHYCGTKRLCVMAGNEGDTCRYSDILGPRCLDGLECVVDNELDFYGVCRRRCSKDHGCFIGETCSAKTGQHKSYRVCREKGRPQVESKNPKWEESSHFTGSPVSLISSPGISSSPFPDPSTSYNITSSETSNNNPLLFGFAAIGVILFASFIYFVFKRIRKAESTLQSLITSSPMPHVGYPPSSPPPSYQTSAYTYSTTVYPTNTFPSAPSSTHDEQQHSAGVPFGNASEHASNIAPDFRK